MCNYEHSYIVGIIFYHNNDVLAVSTTKLVLLPPLNNMYYIKMIANECHCVTKAFLEGINMDLG